MHILTKTVDLCLIRFYLSAVNTIEFSDLQPYRHFIHHPDHSQLHLECLIWIIISLSTS